MIRKAIIVVLTLAAVCVTIIAGMSYAGHLRTPLWQVGNWRLCLYARDTIARVFWFQQHEPMSLDLRSAERGDTLLFDTASGSKYGELHFLTRELLGSKGVPYHKVHVPYHRVSRVNLSARGTRLPPVSVTVVRTSMWTLLLILAAYPALVFIRGPMRRYRRHKRGLCLKCGYDLRASKDRCPECGEEFGSTIVAR